MGAVQMKVTLVNASELTYDFFDRFEGTEFHKRTIGWEATYNENADLMAEAAGRICYESFHLPNPATADNATYLANIKLQQHFSVLEHASFTFLLENVSRCLTHELVRHRHLSFSMRSQRYVDEYDADYVLPPALDRLPADRRKEWETAFERAHASARAMYGELVEEMTTSGATRKEARDAARYLLPEGTATELYVSGNGRSWLELITKRNSPHAAREIRDMAALMLGELQERAPGIFAND